MSFTAKFGPALCLVVLTNGPKEKPVYMPVCDYLFGQGFTPIEVRSPGEALIHTRQARFCLIIIPDDDHELIRKIKSPEGLNSTTIVIAISSGDSDAASTQEMLDLKIVQQVVRRTSNLEEFQKNLLEAVKSQVFNDGMEKPGYAEVTSTGDQDTEQQQNKSAMLQQSNQFVAVNSQSDQPCIVLSQSQQSLVGASPLHQSYSTPSQSQPFLLASQSQQSLVGGSPSLQPYSTSSQSQPFLGTIQSQQSLIGVSQSLQPYSTSSQSQPFLGTIQSQQSLVGGSPSLQPYSTSSPSQPFVGTSQSHQHGVPTDQTGEFLPSLPLQPFTLIPPMIVPYTSLLSGSIPCGIVPSESYMMPRIVDFSSSPNQMLPQIVGQPVTLPALVLTQGQTLETKCEPDSTDDIQDKVADSSQDAMATNTITTGTDVKDESNSNVALPGIQNFLECLCSEEREDTSDVGKSAVDDENFRQRFVEEETVIKRNLISTGIGETAAKRSRKRKIEDKQMSVISERNPTNEEDVDKNPLSVLQARPYFMNLDDQIEGMAFDPKVKASDRHNAKERHRRIRITKAAEFFKEILPCMQPGMDKASAFHVTVYYIIFLRKALRQINPFFVDQLHKSYVKEWKEYFDSTSKNDKLID